MSFVLLIAASCEPSALNFLHCQRISHLSPENWRWGVENVVIFGFLGHLVVFLAILGVPNRPYVPFRKSGHRRKQLKIINGGDLAGFINL